MSELIYLDHNSSAPLAPEALDAMLPYLRDHHGNAASAHAAGRPLAAAVEEARGQLAGLIGADPDEITFTSGGTESNNWVLAGVLPGRKSGRGAGPHVVVSAVEHFSISASARRLEERGCRVSVVPVDGEGRVDVRKVVRALRPQTKLVSLMLAQNEVGSLQPVAEVAAVARERGALVHTDAAQAVGKVPVDARALGVDFLSVAGHKLYGPKGIGALYVRRGVELAPWMLGAPHERGARAGTLNVPGIVGLGAAARLAQAKLASEVPRLRALSRRLWEGLRAQVPGVALNGPPLDDERRLPGTVNVSFPGWRSYELLPLVPEVATTPGAACHSGDPRPSSTLVAMGLPAERAIGAVRFSLGRGTTEGQIDRTVALFARAARA
jgi:cysteine desulfurase